MPHINSIRLVNVHFNNATQFYDDFTMRFGGKNSTYDLENGGGKSLLLQLLLQTVLPKSYLRREKPLSLIFQGGKERTSHVAVEWLLEEGEDYKYLLTGFSARKRRGSLDPAGAAGTEDEEAHQAADIEHLNWCVFYRDHRSTGLESLPLVSEQAGKKSYAGFEEIRKYIQQMRQKGLPADTFDRIDRYQNYIAAHHLLTAEWNIIRGINSGENNIESYFRQNATSRKLIENLFVKIVEDVEALNRGEKNNTDSLLLADTLIELRSRLNEYLRLKGHMTEYEKIKECYEEFGRKNEDFLQRFLEYEACQRQAAAIKNLLQQQQADLERESTAIEARIETGTASRSEAENRQRLLEAGLVNYGKENLLTEQKYREAERDRLAARQAELAEQLNRLKTLESYAQYRGLQAKDGELQQRLQTLAMTGDAIEEDYRATGGRLRYLTDQLAEQLIASLQDAELARDRLKAAGEQTIRDRIDAGEKAAGLQVKLEHLEEQEQLLQQKSQQISAFFLQYGATEALLASGPCLIKLEAQLNQYQTENSALDEKISAGDADLQQLGLAAVKTDGAINLQEERQAAIESWWQEYQRDLSGLEQQAAGFKVNTVEDYQVALQSLLDKEDLHKLEQEIEVGRRRQKKQLAQARGYYVPNEEILALAEKLGTKCEYVQTGLDWVAQAEPEKKAEILQTRPYLPYAVIVDRGSFQKLQNGRIKPDFDSDYPVPVVNLETLRSTGHVPSEAIYYHCGFADLLLNNSLYDRYIQGMAAELETLEREILAAGQRIAELQDQLSGARIFARRYPPAELENKRALLKTLAAELSGLKEHKGALQAREGSLTGERAVLSGRVEELTRLAQSTRDQIDRLGESMRIGQELTRIMEELAALRGELKPVRQTIAGLENNSAALKEQQAIADERWQGINLELHDLYKEKAALVTFAAIASDQDITQVRASYQALGEALSGRNAEETELRSRLAENQARLVQLKYQVQRDYAGDLDEVAAGERSGRRVIIPSQAMIREAMRSKADNDQKLAGAVKQVADIATQVHKAAARLEVLLEGLAEQPSALPRYDTESRYRQELDRAVQLMKNHAAEIEQANQDLKLLKETLTGLRHQLEDYAAFLDREKVADDGTLAAEVRDYRQFEKEYFRLQDSIRQLGAQWEDRLKTLQAETAGFIIREPLEELGKISKPASSVDCLVKKNAFNEYIANLTEQMQKIIGDIRQLEIYQQEFTTRCIQRAELVLGHLKKLESLSRIEVYGRRTNMLELKLPEFEAKDKQLRVKAHIDGIVREIEAAGVIDRKRIAARLATKELLARIVNMEKVSVRLYKIENIPENSRFYRWENAVGSEGQNNSLYFIFAACLISFIRMLSITGTSVRAKKVIIADNPFGATSAVYLWDPMFKIMKQNDIQLIAPGHRIPRELTSRFGVSYLLNQEILQDGRVRVVVKDVRAEEDEAVARYVNAEQLTLNFDQA